MITADDVRHRGDGSEAARASFMEYLRNNRTGVVVKENRLRRTRAYIDNIGRVRVVREKNEDGSSGKVVQDKLETETNLKSGQLSHAVKRALRWKRRHGPDAVPPRHIMLFMKAAELVEKSVYNGVDRR